MANICIGYLADNRRIYTFNQFIYFLNKINNKNNIHLLLLLNNVNPTFFENIIKTNLIDIKYSIILFDNNNNYINKIKTFIDFTKKNNLQYCMKFDNDIIINNYTLDYMINNISLLNDDNNLFITPTLSSGIPTTDYFIEDFFNKEEKEEISRIFLKTDMPEDLWGFNYKMLNDYTIHSDTWDNIKFVNKLNELNYYYKGIHPIRINKEAIEYMNRTILKYKNKIYDEQDYKIQINTNYSYLCNSIFIIDVNKYYDIVNNKELYVDPFDEVPVNKYCQINKLNGIYIRNTFTIHPIYNTIPNFQLLEQQFFKSFFD